MSSDRSYDNICYKSSEELLEQSAQENIMYMAKTLGSLEGDVGDAASEATTAVYTAIDAVRKLIQDQYDLLDSLCLPLQAVWLAVERDEDGNGSYSKALTALKIYNALHSKKVA